MMKKTLIASALATSLMAGSAQAVTLYSSNDGATQLDHYGRLQTELYNNGDYTKIQDSGTRLGFRLKHQQTDQLTAFARLEFRFAANDASDKQEIEARNSYFGAQGDWGKVWFGNFDSIYYGYTSSLLDLAERDGVDFTGGGANGRADSLAYEFKSGDLKFAVMAQHQHDSDEEDDAFNLQAAVAYQLNDLTLSAAFDQNNDDDVIGNSGDPRMGLGLSYQLQDLTLSALAEIEDGETRFGLAAVQRFDQARFYGAFSYTSEDFTGEEEYKDKETAFMVGARYDIAQPLFVYAEATGGDKYDDSTFTLGARYSW